MTSLDIRWSLALALTSWLVLAAAGRPAGAQESVPDDAESQPAVDSAAATEAPTEQPPEDPTISEGFLAEDGPGTEVAPPLGLTLTALVGAEAVTEDLVPDHASLGFSAAVRYQLPQATRVGASVTGRFYRHAYVADTPSLAGDSNLRLEQDERAWDVMIYGAYDLLATVTDAARLDLVLAPRYFQLDSAAFSDGFGGVALGLQAEGALAWGIEAVGGLSWTRGLFGTEETLSRLGVAYLLWDGFAGLRASFAGLVDRETWLVEMRWSTTLVGFEHSTRMYNGGAIGLGVAL